MEIKNTQQSIHFPEEIIEQILSNLQVKSLLRFRCVSKSWCSLIYSKRFVLTHLQVSKNLANQELLIKWRHGHRLIWLSSPLSKFRYLEFSPPTHDQIQSMHLVGSSNGLVCVLLNRNKNPQFMLWNPSTGTSKKLPDITTTTMGCDIIESYGFGWDESSGDYKVIVISTNVRLQEYACTIYSLKTDSWKQKKACECESDHSLPPFICPNCEQGLLACECESDHSLPPFLRPNCEQGLLACGKLHWERGYENMPVIWKIVALDLKREVFEIVEQPSSFCRDCSCLCTYSEMGMLGECLIVNHHHSQYCYCGKEIDIWAMREYEVQEPWEKIISIDRFLEPIWIHPDQDVYYCIITKGEILMLVGRTILITELDHNCFRDRATSSSHYESYDSFVYIGSLVSPLDGAL